MPPIHAYYLPADPASAIDASHPVGVEQLDALGWKISSVGGSPDEIDQAGRKLAREIGYPITQEGGIVQFSLDVETNAGELAPDVIIDSSPEQKIRLLLSKGNKCTIYVRLYVTAGWVRIHFVSGMLVHVPAGAQYRLDFNEQNRETTGTAFFKTTTKKLSSGIYNSDGLKRI
ncbi:hypothetical protein BDP27DRAFT_1367714 [Rhodocollybia butyracea]|uniref:Uncharacterized protein n=1 Tax=Rhodocollybia butyracea TaxID=206335 RepID=A0A9P5U1N9_9AGAR|nr:hypothetical protein BDP27DRAFT_1367714 [Rhodocollybia butyracea]